MSKYENCIGRVNGQIRYKALECGHLVFRPEVKLCRKCYLSQKRMTGRYLGNYKWSAKICGHPVSNNRVDYCRECYLKINGFEKITEQKNYIGIIDGQYKWKALVCGHPSSSPKAKYCRQCYVSGSGKTAKDGIREMWGNGYRGYRHKGRNLPEHRVIAEKVLGRALKPNECVHHINMDKSDNRKCNLLICDRKYHQWLHQRMAELYAQEKFGGK